MDEAERLSNDIMQDAWDLWTLLDERRVWKSGPLLPEHAQKRAQEMVNSLSSNVAVLNYLSSKQET